MEIKDQHFHKVLNTIDKHTNDVNKSIIKKYREIEEKLRKELDDFYKKNANAQGRIPPETLRRYNRLKKLEDRIEKEVLPDIRAIDREIKASIGPHLSLTTKSFNWLFDITMATRFNWLSIKKAEIDELLNNPLSKFYSKKKLSRAQIQRLEKINNKIVQGITEGKTYGEVSRDVRTVLTGPPKKNGGLRYQSERIVRTEFVRAQSAGMNKAFDNANKLGIKVLKLWYASRDELVRQAHITLDGQAADDEGFFHYGGYKAQGPGMWGVAGLDINCRCSERPQIADIEPKTMRDAESNVVPFQSLSEYLKSK